MMSMPRHLAATIAVVCLSACGTTEAAEQPTPSRVETAGSSSPADRSKEFRQLEEKFDARLGVHAIDTGTGRTVGYRADERFAYCSTFEVLAAAQVLDDTTDAELDQVVRYSADDLITYSPITEKHVADGMTLRAIADAALRYSDNTAANLLLRHLGGPQKIKQELRELGDEITEPARVETALNEATPGDRRDTSTPRALAQDPPLTVARTAGSVEARAIAMAVLRSSIAWNMCSMWPMRSFCSGRSPRYETRYLLMSSL